MAELACAGLPAVLVPYPFAAGNHQLHNARFLESAGGAIVLEQKEFAGEKRAALVEALMHLLLDRPRLRNMSLCAKKAANPQAAALVVDGLEKMLLRKRQGA